MLYNRSVLGANIRQLRINKDLSIEELAELIEISVSFLGLVERGQRGLSTEKIVTLINVLGATFEDLLRDENDALLMQEAKAPYVVSGKMAKMDTISTLLSTLNEPDLDYIIACIKAFRQYIKKTRANKGE